MRFYSSPYMPHAPSPQFTLRLMILTIFFSVFWSCNQPGQVGFVVKIWEPGNETSDFKKENPWPESDVLKITWRHELWYGAARLISQDNLTQFPSHRFWYEYYKANGKVVSWTATSALRIRDQYHEKSIWISVVDFMFLPHVAPFLLEFWQRTIRIWRMANPCSYRHWIPIPRRIQSNYGHGRRCSS